MAFKGPFRLGTDSYDGAEWVSDSLGQTVYTSQCPDLLNTLTAERDALKAEREEMREKLQKFFAFTVDLGGVYPDMDRASIGLSICRDQLRREFSFLTEEPKR